MGETWHNAVVQFVFSGGLFISSFTIGMWGGAKKRFLMISCAIALLGGAASVGGILPAGGYWGFVVCCFFMGASGTYFNVPLMAYIQETVAPEMMGKVFSVLTAAMTMATPIGLILAGPLSERIGVDRYFAWAGLLMCVMGIVCFFSTRPYDKGTA